MSVLKRLIEIARSRLPSSPSSDLETAYWAGEQTEPSERRPPVAEPSRPPSREEGYYANLELKPGASYDDIRLAYRNLQRRYHPDHHHADPEQTALALEITKGLNEAMDYFEKKFARERT